MCVCVCVSVCVCVCVSECVCVCVCVCVYFASSISAEQKAEVADLLEERMQKSRREPRLED